MHIADLDAGNLEPTGLLVVVWELAVGAALTQQMKKTGKIVVCFFGDGATNEVSPRSRSIWLHLESASYFLLYQ